MEHGVFEILEELEEIVDRGTKIPMTGKVLVDDTQIFGLIDQLRTSLPEEIRDSQRVLYERQKILDEAKSEADHILERGKSYIEKLAGENEVAKQAQSYAEDLARQAQNYAKDIKLGAVQYSDGLLQQVEKSVGETLQALRHNREELRTLAKQDPRETKTEVAE